MTVARAAWRAPGRTAGDRRRGGPTAWLVLGLLGAVGSAADERPAAPGADLPVPPPVPTPATTLADAAVAGEIVAAVRLAYGLEGAYWENPAAFPTWERLYAHYRQGFSESIAKEMTDYSLSGDGDLATWVPERVEVASIDGPTAMVWFETPAEFGAGGAWGFERYMVVRLRLNEDGRWVVYWATDSAEPP